MNKLSTYYKNLISSVLELSDSSDWQSAVLEWAIEDVVEDETLSESCVCGKENLRYLFTIKNTLNGNKLYPIGSTCIKKFERSDLDEIVSVKEQLFKLLHAIENNEFITLSSQYFSRRLLRYLYDNDALLPTEYNQYEPYNDYQFLLDMFNKRSRSANQNKKATAIILNSIKPYLQSVLQDKIIKCNL